jgi:hypothetical protein
MPSIRTAEPAFSSKSTSLATVLVIALVVLLSSPPTNGHGLLHEQIIEVSAQLEATPNDNALRLRLAELFIAHNMPEKAGKEFSLLTNSLPPHIPALLSFARFEKKQGAHKNALSLIESYHLLGGNIDISHREKATILTALESHQEASKSWILYLDLAKSPTAQEFSDAGISFLTAGEFQKGHHFVGKGLIKFPRSIPLHQASARLFLAQKDLPSAQLQFKKLRDYYGSLLHRLYFDEGLIFEEQELKEEAFERALSQLNKLPPRKQALPALKALKKELQSKISN